MEGKNQDIEERTFKFAVRVIKMVTSLSRNNVVTWKLGGQLIDSSASINSNVVQAKAAVSKADFTNHMRIARKEAKESQRWIQMLIAIGIVSKQQTKLLLRECTEIVSILYAIVKTSEKNKK
ncbi:four helix bundle protein [Patescibacteria group bacterium]|nr:four helix bundle protein [Patescibacteria group bacterium]